MPLLSSLSKLRSAFKPAMRESAAILSGSRAFKFGSLLAKDAMNVSTKIPRLWTKIPRGLRRRTIVGAVGIAAGISATREFIGGYKEGVMSPEDMYNKAHGYGQLGDEKYFRNQGRMSSNHLGHAGIGLSMSRLRHG